MQTVSKIDPEVVMNEERIIGTVTTGDISGWNWVSGRTSYESKGELIATTPGGQWTDLTFKKENKPYDKILLALANRSCEKFCELYPQADSAMDIMDNYSKYYKQDLLEGPAINITD